MVKYVKKTIMELQCAALAAIIVICFIQLTSKTFDAVLI